MPGIVGLVTRMPRGQAEPQLVRMVETLCHEPFYAAGTWIDEPLGVYVGWVARKNSFCDGMPLRNERGDVTLVFSGEEFPEPGLRDELSRRGHKLDTAECSYLVHLYEEDTGFPAGLNGRFHGLLVDRTRRTATLFNDRYGMHRIYYHEAKHAFYFAAEAKAILEVCPRLRRLDPRGLGEYVTCGCVLENRTLFEGLQVLPGAAAWVCQNGAIERKGVYFQPREWEEQAVLAPVPYYREIREVFSRNLPRYFEGRERIAMSLTGGLDTRMIMAWHKPRPRSLPCYTFGSMFRDSRDVVVAGRLAKICGQSHEAITVGDEFLSRFPHYAERALYLTDGCVDVSRAPDLYVNERAREIAPVRMTGNYGGELLRRVRAFKPVELMAGLLRPEVMPYIRQANETYARLLRAHPVSFAVFEQAPWFHFGSLALEETQLSLRSPYLDNELVQAVYSAPEWTLASDDVCLGLIADGDADLGRIPTDRGVGVGGGAAGAAAAVARRLLNMEFKAEYAYDIGMPQWLAQIDHRLSRLRFERLILGRHKVCHFRVWYRDALAAYVRDVLLDPRTLARPYLDRTGVERIVESHARGDRNYTAEIHAMLSIELLHRVLLDPH